MLAKFSILRVLSILGGLALVGVAAYLNVHHAAESEGGNYLAPVCIAIVALAFASALAVPVMLALWRNGHRVLACAGLVGLVCGESYDFQLSAERLLAARAQRAQQVQTAGSPYELAREALDLAIKDRKAECSAKGSPRRRPGAGSDPRDDIAPGRGPARGSRPGAFAFWVPCASRSSRPAFHAQRLAFL